MCHAIVIEVTADGAATVMPTDCAGDGATCRALSAPYRAALGRTVLDTPAADGRSHVVDMQVVVRDLDALEHAAPRVGLEFRRDQRTHRPEAYGTCAHALAVPGDPAAYEIGVVPAADGDGYRLVWDNFAGGHGLCARVESAPGRRDAGKLLQAYAVEAARGEARRLGQHVLAETSLEDGKIRLRVAID